MQKAYNNQFNQALVGGRRDVIRWRYGYSGRYVVAYY